MMWYTQRRAERSFIMWYTQLRAKRSLIMWYTQRRAKRSLIMRFSLAKHETPGHMVCREELGLALLSRYNPGVLIGTLLTLSATVLWTSGNIFSTQFRAAAGIAKAGTA